MDSDEENYVPKWKGVPATIILLNIYDPHNHNFAQRAKSAVEEIVKRYLRSSSSKNIAVCVYGIEDENSALLDAKGILEIIPLTQPTVEDYKKLRDTDIEQLKQSTQFKMSDALWHCSKIFANFKKQVSSKSLLILTRLDTPPIDVGDHTPSLNRVKDLIDAEVNIKFVNVSQDDYKIHEFYKNFLMEVYKGPDFISPPPIWSKEEIVKVLYQESQRHLPVAQLNLEIGHNFVIGVGLYSLIKQNSYKKQNIDRDTNTPLISVTKKMKIINNQNDVDESEPETEQNTELPVLDSEIIHYMYLGGEKISFTDTEIKKLKNPFGSPRIKLLGFKPSATLCKEKWFLNTCYFLYPNESLVVGSTVAFKAMFQACQETSTVAICALCSRVNARPKLVALSPSNNPLGLDLEIGFDVIQIPFIENVRDIPEIEDSEELPSQDHIDIMKDVIKGIQFEFKTTTFENPKVQAEHRAIEIIALEDEDIEPFHDITVADNDVYQIINADLFNKLFGPFHTVAQKRKTTGSTDKNADNIKRKKEEDKKKKQEEKKKAQEEQKKLKEEQKKAKEEERKKIKEEKRREKNKI